MTRDCLALISLFVGMLIPISGLALSPYETVQQGNVLYQAGQYHEAAQHYNAAKAKLPEAAEIHFNQGNAFYKQRAYTEAFQHYNEALRTTKNATLESRAKYNLGNVKYQQALQALSAPQEALAHLQSAMTYYRDSLDVEPHYQDARYNLELAQRLLHQLQQSQSSAPQNTQQQQDASQPQEQPEDQQQAQPRQAQSNAPGQPEPQAQPEKQAQKPEEQPRTPSTSSPEQQPEQMASSEPTTADNTELPQHSAIHRDLSPQEAEQLLEMIRERAREAERIRNQWRQGQASAPRVDKDW